MDAIVIGLGAMGSAALYQLARRGVRVMGVDRFAPPHDRGSSHGETRITRQGIGEGDAFSPLAIASHRIWRELERETGTELLLACGFVAIDGAGDAGVMHGKPGFYRSAVAAAQRFGIAYQELGVDEMRHRFPQFALTGHEQCYYEPHGGVVFPERCIGAQLDRARALGATVRTNETVVAIARDGDGVRVDTDQGSYRAGKAILAAGPWTPGLAPRTTARLRVLRQVLHWFESSEPSFNADRCPSFIWQHGPGEDQSFYGFPVVPGVSTPGVKVACEQYQARIDGPAALDRDVSSGEIGTMYRDHVRGRLVGVSSRSLASAACMYTFAPQGNFLIDWDADDRRLLIVSACSGHGFKHSAGIGEQVARIVVGDDAPDTTFGRAHLAPALTAAREPEAWQPEQTG